MKFSFLRCCGLLAVIALAGCRHSIPSKDSMNLDFEISDSLANPAHWTSTALGAIYSLDSQTFEHGAKSMSISSQSDSQQIHSLYQDLMAPKSGDSVILSGFLKTDHVAGSGSFYLWVLDEKGIALSSKALLETTRVSGTKGWSEYSISVPRAPNAVLLRIGIMLQGSGRLWADNLQLTVDGKPYSMETLPRGDRPMAATDTEVIRAAEKLPVNPTPGEVRKLADLGELWVFLKYHATRPDHIPGSCDRFLFAALPALMAANSEKEVEQVQSRLIDAFLLEYVKGSAKASGDVLSPPDFTSAPPQPASSGAIKNKPDYGHLFMIDHFSETTRNRLDSILHKNAGDGNPYVRSTRLGNPGFIKENPFYSSFPNAAIRLLTLFRYWGVIQYYYPYRPLLQGAWNDVLSDFIPEVLNAGNNLSFTESILKMVVKLGDSHATLGNNFWLDSLQGKYSLPIHCGFIENKLVIEASYVDSATGSELRPGDIVSSIDGILVKDLVDEWLPLTPGSNLPYRLQQLSDPFGFLLRSSNQDCSLVVSRGGKSLIKLTFRRNNDFKSAFDPESIDRFGCEVKDGIGFLNPSKMFPQEFAKIRQQLQHTKGIVVDFRCYAPYSWPNLYTNWLVKDSPEFFGTTVIDTKVPGQIRQAAAFKVSSSKGDHYMGKLVVLVNSRTISNSEFATMALQTIPGAVVVGSQTAGADGDKSPISLLSDFNTNISGIGIYYPNGDVTQRDGVKINVRCSPTIAGIREGRDEVLEKAVRLINTSN